MSTLARTIFEQPGTASVRAQHNQVVTAPEAKFPHAAAHLDEARDDILAFTAFLARSGDRVWGSNPLERLNKEIRRLAMWLAYSRAGMPSSASPVPFLPGGKAGAMPGPGRLRLPGGPLRPGRITQGR